MINSSGVWDDRDLESYSDVLNIAGDIYCDNIFITEYGGRDISYGEFNLTVNRCCNYFNRYKINTGDVITVVLKNSIDFLVIYFASLRSGVIVNPLPHQTAVDEIITISEKVKPKIIFTGDFLYEQLLKCNKELNVTNIDNYKNGFIEYLYSFDCSFDNSKKPQNPIAAYYVSSGTTGEQKVICYSHKSMVRSQISMFRSGFSKEGDIHLCFLPLGHTAALRYTVKQLILSGSKVVLCESFWKIRTKLWDIVEKYKITFFQTVPSILVMILNTKFSIKKTQFKSIRFVGCGSAFLSKELQNQFQEKYGLYLSNMYGLSETGATHFDNPFVNERSTGNIGKPFDIYDIAIINNGKECLPNTIGEIGIKGDGLFSGYLNENNNELYWDGYFLTGDIGKVDSSGLCHYVERKKDLIIRGGINILPSSIDSILLENKAVVESATIGAYDPVYGEKVISYIVCKEQVDIESMLNECKKQIGTFKAPSEIILVDRLPKGPSGKILKRVLREKVR